MEGYLLDKKQFDINLGNLLRDVRQEKGLSQERMAKNAGLAGNYLGEVERGKKCITVYKLVQLLEANDISVSKFMERV